MACEQSTQCRSRPAWHMSNDPTAASFRTLMLLVAGRPSLHGTRGPEGSVIELECIVELGLNCSLHCAQLQLWNHLLIEPRSCTLLDLQSAIKASVQCVQFPQCSVCSVHWSAVCSVFSVQCAEATHIYRPITERHSSNPVHTLRPLCHLAFNWWWCLFVRNTCVLTAQSNANHRFIISNILFQQCSNHRGTYRVFF